MNTSIDSNHHIEEQDLTTDEMKRKRTTSTLLIPVSRPETYPLIKEEEAEELQNKQASLSCQSITLPVPATVVVVICEPRGLSNPITMGSRLAKFNGYRMDK